MFNDDYYHNGPLDLDFDPTNEFMPIDNEFDNMNVFEFINGNTTNNCVSTVTTSSPAEATKTELIRDVNAIKAQLMTAEQSNNYSLPSPDNTSGYNSTSSPQNYDSRRFSDIGSDTDRSPGIPTFYQQTTVYHQENIIYYESNEHELLDTCFPSNDYGQPLPANSLKSQGCIPYATRASNVGNVTSASLVNSIKHDKKVNAQSERNHSMNVSSPNHLSIDTNNNDNKVKKNNVRKRKATGTVVNIQQKKERRKETNRNASRKYREKQENKKRNQEQLKVDCEQELRRHEMTNTVLKAKVELLTGQLIKSIRSKIIK